MKQLRVLLIFAAIVSPASCRSSRPRALGSATGITVAGRKPKTITAQKYVAREGDTLSDIAERVYGDASKAGFLYRINRRRLGNSWKLTPGMVILIPDKLP